MAEALFVTRGRDILKSDEEIMEMFDAYDLIGSFRDAAEVSGCSHHTVDRYVAARSAGGEGLDRPVRRSQLIDPYLGKVDELVDRSKGKIRADKVHAKLPVCNPCTTTYLQRIARPVCPLRPEGA